MTLNKKTAITLEKFVEARTSSVEVDEDFGLRCLHLSELDKELKGFYEIYNPENTPNLHQEIFEYAISYLEDNSWNEATLEGEAGYLVRG